MRRSNRMDPCGNGVSIGTFQCAMSPQSAIVTVNVVHVAPPSPPPDHRVIPPARPRGPETSPLGVVIVKSAYFDDRSPSVDDACAVPALPIVVRR